jgi:hypothetical protein
MRCESGDQRDDEECECDGRAAALQRHCGVSATGEWRRLESGVFILPRLPWLGFALVGGGRAGHP